MTRSGPVATTGTTPTTRACWRPRARRGVALPIPAPLALGAVGVDAARTVARRSHRRPPGLSVNDASLVLRIDFAGRGALFPGDLEADGEGELAGRRALGQRIAADVLKVPHHGSRTSSSPELSTRSAPRWR